MARKPRIEYEGAFFHVITRGNQKQKIFRNIPDFQKYLTLLFNYKQRYHFQLYGFVLMENHILHNPLRARLAKTPATCQWSSHCAYLAGTDTTGLVDTEPILRMFSEHKGRARKYYEAFMNDGISVEKEDIYAIIDQRLLGDEKFIEHVTQKYEGEIRKERKKKEYTLSQMATAIEKICHITLEDLRSWSRRPEVLRGRRVISLTAREYAYTGGEIAAYLKKDPAAVTGYLRQGVDLKEEVDKVVKGIERTKIKLNL